MNTKSLAVLILFGLFIISCGNNQTKKEKTEKDNNQTEVNQMEEKDLKDVKLVIETTEGDITIKLYDETPLHRDNFVKLVKNNFYDGVIFHRIIKNFMIQTGDPESKNPVVDEQYGKGGPGYTIQAEFNSKFIHKKGALAAARQGDQVNPERASSGSQFYIVQGEKFDPATIKNNPNFNYTEEQLETYKTIGGTPHLDGMYTVFGEVTDGLDIVDKIASVETNSKNRPLKDVVITKITIVK